MDSKALVIDYKYCTGCHSCEVACRKEKGLPLDEWGIKLAEQGPVQLDGKWMWNYVPVPSNLCDLCEERVEAGKKPSCVHNCLAACMFLIDVDEVPAKLAEVGKTAVVFVP